MSRKPFIFGEHLQVRYSWVQDSLNLDRFREMIHLFSASSEGPPSDPGPGAVGQIRGLSPFAPLSIEHSMRSPSCPASLSAVLGMVSSMVTRISNGLRLY